MSRKLVHKMIAGMVALLLMLSIGLPTFATTEIDSSAVNRYNVVLVIDGSGSLIMSKGGTDTTGLRYDAMKLFLGLLTDAGNNVGAIVFNDGIMLNTGLSEVQGQSNKLAFVSQIEKAGVGGDTNIGTALLEAVKMLEGKTEENGLPSVVLLLSDGETDGVKTVMEQSYQDAGSAIELANANDIVINGIWLNSNSNGAEDEIAEITSRTGGTYEEVSNATGLTAAFERFYSTINNTEGLPVGAEEFDSEGHVTLQFTVPSFGVEEVNVIMKSDAVTNLEATKPDGTSLSNASLQSDMIVTDQYQLLKIVSPQAGTWTLDIEGTPGSTVDVSMLCNATLNANMEIINESECYMVGATINTKCTVEDMSGYAVTENDYQKMTAKLIMVNANTQEVYEAEMQAKGVFEGSIEVPEDGMYYLYAEIDNEGIVFTTDKAVLNVGNLPPVAVRSAVTKTVRVGLFQSGVWSYDLADLFEDPEEEALSYELEDVIVAPVDIDEIMEIAENEISIDCTEIEDDCCFTIVATDPMGARAYTKVLLETQNITPIILGIVFLIVLIVLIVLLVLYRKKHNVTCRLSIGVSSFNIDNPTWEDPVVLEGFGYQLPLFQFSVSGTGLQVNQCYFQATADPEVCEFRIKGKGTFYVDGQARQSVTIHGGSNIQVAANQEQTCGIEINASRGFSF